MKKCIYFHTQVSWPKLGETVNEQLLDGLMISQILEQNLTLFFSDLKAKSGPVGERGPKGAPGERGRVLLRNLY